jgi:hypothetical protein
MAPSELKPEKSSVRRLAAIDERTSTMLVEIYDALKEAGALEEICPMSWRSSVRFLTARRLAVHSQQ